MAECKEMTFLSKDAAQKLMGFSNLLRVNQAMPYEIVQNNLYGLSEPTGMDKVEGIRRWFIEDTDVHVGRFEPQYLGAGKNQIYKAGAKSKFYWGNWRREEFTHFERFLVYEMGNGVCSNLLNTPECCYDGGDCIFPKPRVYCPMCNWEITLAFGDFVCDEKYNHKDCCFDEGDCFNVSL
jgi:hypothetical protein